MPAVGQDEINKVVGRDVIKVDLVLGQETIERQKVEGVGPQRGLGKSTSVEFFEVVENRQNNVLIAANKKSGDLPSRIGNNPQQRSLFCGRSFHVSLMA